ncbi:RDD family protein [Arenimonas sp.]|uniref:RDD family protein n=1 Tax=Arenimonas sp. TaxID=1872635 RepID=UPI0025C4DD73|nr:RDD family protein [Arenimonas sp.]
MNRPAGFWRRYAAYSADASAISLLALPLLWHRLRDAWGVFDEGLQALQSRIFELLDLALARGDEPLRQLGLFAFDEVLRAELAGLAGELLWLALAVSAGLFVVAAVWFVSFESSRWQASPGKRLLGLRVTDVHGARCGPGRIALRFVAGIPSWLVLHLGHALAAWTPGKRALHDYLAGTRVELAPGAPEAMPRGGRSWLLLQAALFFGAVGLIMLRYLQLILEVAQGGL